jgi:hypothetical protein
MRSRILSVFTAAFFVLCGSAFGQFLPNLPQFGNGVRYASFEQADVNNDGKPDIIGFSSASAIQANYEIIVMLGNGTGGFGAPVTTAFTALNPLPSPDGGSTFAFGDFNDDGKVDAAVFGTDKVTGQLAVEVLLGNGDGTFQSGKETILASGIGVPSTQPCSYITGDYNGDGKLDLAYASITYSGNIPASLQLVVLPGNGNGTFGSAVVTAGVGGCLATGDFNGDKKLDLATPSAILLGNGNGTFQARTINVKASGLIEAADLNGDGHLDLVSSNGVVLLGDGTGHFPNINTFETNGEGQSNSFAIVDVNGDGHPDIVQHQSTADRINIFLNSGSGTFTPANSYVDDGETFSAGFVATDLNGDGKVDLAFENGAGGISVLTGNGNATFSGNTALTGIVGDKVAAFNGGANLDMLSSGSTANWMIGNGNGTFTFQATNCTVTAAAVGDFNRDGKIDYAGLSSSGGTPFVQVCLNNGDGTFTAVNEHFDVGVQHGQLLAGDFNGDGKLDLFATDEGGFSILLGNGDGTFQNGIPMAFSSPSNPVLADFNHDGKLDIAMIGGTSEAPLIDVFLGNGNGTFQTPVTTPTKGGVFMVGTDVNGDGKPDLVMTGGNLIIMLGNGNGTFQAPVIYAVPGTTRPWIADFNLDGHVDIAFADSTAKMVYLFFGNGTGKFPTRTSFRVPLANGLAVGDFNNDHKPDLAVDSSTPNQTTIELMLHQ